MKKLLTLIACVILLSAPTAYVLYRRIPEPAPQKEEIQAPPGHWSPVRKRNPLTDEQRKRIRQLESIGYLEAYEEAPDLEGVTHYDPEHSHPGLNLLLSGHAPEVSLVDMKGRVLHEWSIPFSLVSTGTTTVDAETNCLRRGALLPNGELLAIFEGAALVKLDRDSRMIWEAQPGYHHDLDIDENGLIYALTRKARIIPRIHERQPFLEDSITILTPDGHPIRTVSLLECFENSEYASFLEPMHRFGDAFHTNTLELLDGSQAGKSPVFRKGNILISVRNLDAIAIVDLDAEKVVWALHGPWKKQHEPTFLENGRLLLFDNMGQSLRSTVYEIEPLSGDITWFYREEEPEAFFSKLCGTVHPLSNGNILVSESLAGRAFELTRDKQIVWEYYNPHRSGPNGELIACLYDVVRYEPSYCKWLDRPTDTIAEFD